MTDDTPAPLHIAIFGLGYVGTAAAGCIASGGHSVLGVDLNADKVEAINAGRSPVFEPGLDARITEARAAGQLRAITQPSAAELRDELNACDIALVCVGTPSGADGAHDMRAVAGVTRSIAAAIDRERSKPLTLVYRSTMRPGTCESLIWPLIEAELGSDAASAVELVYNPEFLREGSAIADYFAPPKVVIGTRSGEPSANMDALYADIDALRFQTSFPEAELTKFIDNSWHALKVAFANEVGRICELQEISAATVHDIFVSDTKLNISPAYLRPGNAFGGSCLPKDVRALQNLASDNGAATHVIDALIRSNEAHKHHQFLTSTAGLEAGAKVLLVGIAFKPETDDLRESPAVDMARKLLDAGYDLDVFDPQVDPAALTGQNLGYAHAFLPRIDDLLVDRGTAETRDYAAVIATNRLIDSLKLDHARVIDISAIA